MDQPVANLKVTVAAGTAGRAYWFHPGKTVKVKTCKLMPNATSTANGTNYATVALYKGSSTQLGSNRTTASTDLTQGTAEAFDVSAESPTDLTISETSPLNLRVTHAASGVIVDVSMLITYEEVRA